MKHFYSARAGDLKIVICPQANTPHFALGGTDMSRVGRIGRAPCLCLGRSPNLSCESTWVGRQRAGGLKAFASRAIKRNVAVGIKNPDEESAGTS